MKLEYFIKITITTLATLLTKLFGGWDMAIQVLIIMLVLDYITGVAKSFCNHKLSSDIGAKGLLKKIMILVIIVVAYQIDNLLGQSNIIRTAVIYFYVANEGISILENLGEMGVPFPKILKERLLQLKKEE